MPLFTLSFLLFPLITQARSASEITDWYLKDFHSDITVNTDGTIDVTEKITADCGDLPDKHGIFRVLPTRFKLDGKFIETPIKLIDITDLVGQDYMYSESTDQFNHTLTWKIGDPNISVTGANDYILKYRIRNTIIDSRATDRFFWNLSGNQWGIPIDKFSATVTFPPAVNKINTLAYFGTQGSTNSDDLKVTQLANNVINFETSRTIVQGEGVSADFSIAPNNMISNAGLTWFELYDNYLFVLIPILIFVFIFNYWKKYGRDHKVNKSIMAEYEPPKNLSAGAVQFLARGGYFDNNIVTAELIYLATKGHLKIEEIEKKGLFGGKDYKLTKIDKSDKLLPYQDILLGWFFQSGSESLLSSIKKDAISNNKYLKIFQDDLRKYCEDSGYIEKGGATRMIVFIILGVILIVGGFYVGSLNLYLAAAIIISGIIAIIFGALMPKLTQSGAELAWQIKGLKLFMTTAEKYRQQFNEKENIFDKLLPYAIGFGITGLWIKKMKLIYGDQYFGAYHPIWYYGAIGSFDVDSFTSAMNSVTSAVSSASSSGSGGAGGGGGGGGGGGW